VASENEVIVTEPVGMAVGMSVTMVLTSCSNCGTNFKISKVVQGLAGDNEPKVERSCPCCGASVWV
jgi:ribosomal protein S27AE